MTLPTALREMLVRARAELKKSMNPEATTLVSVGWAEVRAVYVLHASLKNALASRNEHKTALSKTNANLEKNRADVVDHDLLDNVAVLGLLTAAERAMSGNATDREMFDTRDRLRAFLARAKKADRQKNRRRSYARL